ncbi:hypothetical protein OIV83_006136 [Microbotryomycetes sp. JL201]|nr:hypothetical protein OIV83_006136 [Microbotryomycetes sp. JL201]
MNVLTLAATAISRGHGPPADTSSSVVRLGLASVAISYALVRAIQAPDNLFLILAPSQSLFDLVLPVLRTPLDVRISTDSLARLWLARLGQSKLDDGQLALLGRMQTLDARLIYIAYGKDALLNCQWCSPTVGSSDYLALTLVSLCVNYLITLGVAGALTSGARSHWRRWLAGAIISGAAIEIWSRLSWRSTTAGLILMCLFLRQLLFAATIALAYFAKPKASQLPWTGTADVLQDTLQALSDRSGALVDELQMHETERRVFATNELLRQRVFENGKRLGFEIQSARADAAVIEARARVAADALVFDDKVKNIYCRGLEPESVVRLDQGPVLSFRQFRATTDADDGRADDLRADA